MRRTLTIAAVLVLISTRTLHAQLAGPEFRVNISTTNDQSEAHVSADGSGNFVVAYTGRDNATSSGILARRFSATGAPLTSEFVVNAVTTDNQFTPVVAMGPDGRFVVVFHAFKTDDDQGGLYARMFFPNGEAIGGEFRVNSYTTGVQQYQNIVMAKDGGFFVVWAGEGYTDNLGIFGRRFDPGGAVVGNDMGINTYTPFDQRSPSVAVAGDGAFLVTWFGTGFDESDGFEVYGRLYSPELSPRTPGFRINAITTGSQNSDAAAGLKGGGFVVVWQDTPFGGTNDSTVFAQRIDGYGTPLGGPFRVNTYTTGAQLQPTAVGDPSGGFLVVWRSDDQDGSDRGVFAQRFAATGEPIGGELRVNTYTTGRQHTASVAALGPGRFAVAWTSLLQDGDYGGVYAQRLSWPSGDVNGDGTVSVADVLYLINHLFAGGPAPTGRADVDGNGTVNVSDVLYLINNLFAGGPAPI